MASKNGTLNEVDNDSSGSSAASSNTGPTLVDFTDDSVLLGGTTKDSTASPTSKQHKKSKAESLEDSDSLLTLGTESKPTTKFTRYNESEKAFVLHHGRHCSFEELVDKFIEQFGRDHYVDKVSLRHQRNYLISNGYELNLLNKATTYDWYSPILAQGQAEAPQTARLEDCNEEHRAFIVHHARHGLHRPRIVEMFYEEFDKGIQIEVLENILSVLLANGDEPELVEAALNFDWNEVYLPKPRRAPKSKAQASPSGDVKQKEPKPARKPSSGRKYKPICTYEQRVYIAWMGRRTQFKQPVYRGFRQQFGNVVEEFELQKKLKRSKTCIGETDKFLVNVQDYSWWERDAREGEPGFERQDRVRRQLEARRRINQGIPNHALRDAMQKDHETASGALSPNINTASPNDALTRAADSSLSPAPERSGAVSPNIDAIREALQAAKDAPHQPPWLRQRPERESYVLPNINSPLINRAQPPTRESYVPPKTNFPSGNTQPTSLEDLLWAQRHRHHRAAPSLSRRSATPGAAEARRRRRD